MERKHPEYLTAEDLKNRLYNSLRDRGLVDSLKSQLRNNLVAELQQSAHGNLSLRDLRVPENGSLFHRAANSLIADHMKHCKYDYSLSVFLPESGTSAEKIFGIQDIVQLLNISSESHLYKKLVNAYNSKDKSNKGFLWQLLTEISSLHARSTQEFGVQTDLIRVGPITSLDEKLHSLEDLYSSKKEESYRTGATAIEERILSFQRKLEERYQGDLRLEISRIRENEISRIRMDECEKARKELERARREMERTYQEKFDSLILRERNSIERLKKEQEMQEKEIYAQRQSILEEIELVRHRENEVKRESEVNSREKKLLQDRINAKEDDVRKRELEVKRLETEFNQRLHNEMTKFKLEVQAKFVDRTQNLETRESKVKDNEKRISEEKDKLHSMKDELRDKTQRVNELETKLQEAKHSEFSANRNNEFLNAKLRDVADYKVIKEQNAVLRNEMESLRTRLSEVLQMNERERTRQEELLREMRQPQLLAQDSLRNEQLVFDHHKVTMEGRLRQENDRNRSMGIRYEEQTLQIKEMNREISDLREQLASTQKALNNDLYRKPHPVQEVRSEQSTVNVSRRSARSPTNYDGDDEIFKTPKSKPLKKQQVDNEVYDEVDIDLDVLKPASRHGGFSDFSTDDLSSPNSADVIAEAKYRLKSLEREAHNLEKAYVDFHYNMTNPQALVPELSKKPRSQRLEEIEQEFKPITSQNRRSYHLASPGQSPIAQDRPLSSTPYRQRLFNGDQDDSFEELSRGSREKNKASSDNLPDFEKEMENERMDRFQENRVEKNRPITMSDLEARPGSPSVVIVPGSLSSAGHSPTRETGSKERFGTESDRRHEDSKPSRLAPISLDTAWKTPSEQDAETEKRLREEEELKQWEEERKRKDEERRNKDEEAWENEQKELQKLQGGLKDDEDVKLESEKETIASDEGIDPVMKQYMDMVKQQKQKEQNLMKKTTDTWSKGHRIGEDKTPSMSENEFSVADDVKSNNGSDDESAW